MPTILSRSSGYPVSESLIDEMLDEFAPSLSGRKVLVKPNCLMASSPEEGVTTHPSLVRALVLSLKRRGARVWVGDNPGARGSGANEHCFRETGLLEAAEGSFVNFGRTTIDVPISSRFLDRVVVSRHVLEADVVISVPKLKTHCLTLMTGAVKNMYGILAGGEKTKLHAVAAKGSDFSEILVDVYSVRPPDLALMDAVVVMEGDGPSHGPLRTAGKILASDNAVSLDGAVARMMGVEPRRIGHLGVAAERGLGPLEGEAVRVDGDFSPLKNFSWPTTFRQGLTTFLSNRVVFNLLHRSRLHVNPEECVGCGECLDACPANAMEERDGGFLIDNDRCHQCFCCYELCPIGAVKVRGALGALLRRQKQ